MSTNDPERPERPDRVARADRFKNLADATQTAQTLRGLNAEIIALRVQITNANSRLTEIESALDGLTVTATAAVEEVLARPVEVEVIP
jgi:predicted  nucleic acid-binding Zn-ribbon protein